MKILVVGLSGESVFLECDHFNKPGETIQVKSKFTEPGGKGFNQAYALSALTSNVSFITVLAENNSYNKTIEKTLNKLNLYPIYKKGEGSYAVIQTNKDGDNNVLVHLGVSDIITKDDIDLKLIKKTDLILLQLELPLDVICFIIDICYKLKKKIILNPAPYKPIPDENLKKVDILTPNEFELKMLAKEEDIEKALVKLKCPNIIVTRGEKDIIYKTNNEIKTVKTKKVEALDTTGAGDIFNAFLVYYLTKLSLEESIKKASYAASLSTMKKGVIDAIKDIDL